jgi:hypothetical protein
LLIKTDNAFDNDQKRLCQSASGHRRERCWLSPTLNLAITKLRFAVAKCMFGDRSPQCFVAIAKPQFGARQSATGAYQKCVSTLAIAQSASGDRQMRCRRSPELNVAIAQMHVAVTQIASGDRQTSFWGSSELGEKRLWRSPAKAQIYVGRRQTHLVRWPNVIMAIATTKTKIKCI